MSFDGDARISEALGSVGPSGGRIYLKTREGKMVKITKWGRGERCYFNAEGDGVPRYGFSGELETIEVKADAVAGFQGLTVRLYNRNGDLQGTIEVDSDGYATVIYPDEA